MNEMSMGTANALASVLNNGSSIGLIGSDHINKVSGIEGMASFQTKANSSYALFEESSDIFCFKTTDAMNNPTMRYFTFNEITKEEAISKLSPYIMKGELESFETEILSTIRSELSSFKEEILNAQQSVRNNANASKPYGQQRNRANEPEQQ